ncbi:mitochondrial-processing peptidase subunit beta [Achlya hypogyna]|uniref:mitochondrial processing peptidase n=1 Tax=Achlya hypogyna TaxID=1202772 RepID=A0A1V9ZSM5_ACHHY|nr:mitochondrial-processing peptidase subunit beta [Achlya hypogyna]
MLSKSLQRMTRGYASKSFPAYVLNAPATEVTTLANGLRVASEGGHGETATVGVWIGAGSRYETEANNGAAHFLEHMAFKGTAKRTQQQLEMEIENMGGHLNAYTSREQTVYYAKVFKKDVPQALDILSDILQNSKLDEAAIERERDVILREMEEVNKQQEEVIFDRLHETAFMGNGLGRTILGSEENVRSLSKADLQDYIATHYTAPRMVVAGAGAVDHSQLVDLAQSAFGNLPSEPRVAPTLETPRFVGSDIRLRDDDLPLAHVAIGFEGYGWTSEHSFPLLVMQTLLGSWDRTSSAGMNMSSKLGQVVAEQELAHSFMSFNTCYQDTGLFGIYAVADKYKLNDLTWYIMEAMVRLVHKTSDEEVERAKTQLKASILMQLDGSSPVCEDIGRQLLVYGRRLTPAEIFARIDAVDAAAIRATADQVINDKEHALAAVGPIHELPDYNFIRRRSYWLSR